MTRLLSPLKLLVLAQLATCCPPPGGAPAAWAQSEPPTVVLAVEKARTKLHETESHDWTPFEDYLNEALARFAKERDEKQAVCRLRLVVGTDDDRLRWLQDDDSPPGVNEPGNASAHVAGAMLPPHRYVIASLDPVFGNDLRLLARVRRAGTTEFPKAPVHFHEEPAPRAGYYSIVLMRRAAGVWPPPDPDGPSKPKKLGFRFTNYRSTSTFVFPTAFFRSTGLLKPGHERIHFRPRDTASKLEDVWTIPSTISASKGEARAQDPPQESKEPNNFEILLDPTNGVDLLGTSPYFFEIKVPDKSDRKRDYRVCYKSPLITFDPFVVRLSRLKRALKTSNQELAMRCLKDIRRALVESTTMSSGKRNECFPWGEKGGNTYGRNPDIHDWVYAEDEDYDVIRRAATVASGGTVVRLAVSRRVHRANDSDRPFFRGLMREQLRVKSKKVFLDITYRAADEFEETVSDLRAGRLDLAELNAFYAAEVVGSGDAMPQAKSLFEGRSGPPEANHRFVMLSARASLPSAGPDLEKLLQDASFAYTTTRSASSYRFPLLHLEQHLSIRPAPEQLVPCGDARSVVQALINRAKERKEKLDPQFSDQLADFGFIAEWEYDEILTERPEVSTLGLVDLVPEPIPNALIVASTGFCPSMSRPGAFESKPPGWIKRLVQWIAGSSPPDDFHRNKDAVKSVFLALRDRPYTGDDTKFKGYREAVKADVDVLIQGYRRFNPDQRPLIWIIVIGVVLVPVILAFVAYRVKTRRDGYKEGEEFSVQSWLQLLAGVIPREDRERKQVGRAIALSNQLEVDAKKANGDEGAWADKLRVLDRELGARLLVILRHHKQRRDTTSDQEHYGAYKDLADTMAEIKERTGLDGQATAQGDQDGGLSFVERIVGLTGKVLQILKGSS